VCALPPTCCRSQDACDHRIRRIDLATGSTTTLAGTGSSGYANGGRASATFSTPYGVAIDPSGTFALVAVRHTYSRLAWLCALRGHRPLVYVDLFLTVCVPSPHPCGIAGLFE
jgi:hypothetical protein